MDDSDHTTLMTELCNITDSKQADCLPLHSKLNHYRIMDILGRGGFGITYLAKNERIDTYVAIKEYYPAICNMRRDEQGKVIPSQERKKLFLKCRSQFLQEARNTVKFSHPNIVRVIDLFGLNNTIYMVMDFENADTLTSVIKTQSIDSEKKALEIFLPLCDGLNKMHAAHFLHRDVKPGNIIIRKDRSPVLLDFGSAREISMDVQKAMTVIFTPSYAPPEQYEDNTVKPQGPWGDIYSLCAVMYHMISGIKPIDSRVRALQVRSHQKDPMEPLHRHASKHFSKSFADTIDYGMKVNIEDRPQSIDELLAFFERQRDLNSLRVYMETDTEEKQAKLMGMIDGLEFFDVFNELEKTKFLFMCSKVLTCEPNITILKEGEDGDAFFLLLKGSVMVKKTHSPMPPAELKSGDMFGELSFLGHTKRISSIVSIERCLILEVDHSVLERLGCELREKLKDRIIQYIIRRFMDMNAKMQMLHGDFGKEGFHLYAAQDHQRHWTPNA